MVSGTSGRQEGENEIPYLYNILFSFCFLRKCTFAGCDREDLQPIIVNGKQLKYIQSRTEVNSSFFIISKEFINKCQSESPKPELDSYYCTTPKQKHKHQYQQQKV